MSEDEQSLPRDESPELFHRHQRKSLFGERRMLGKQRLDVVGASRREPIEADSPAPAG